MSVVSPRESELPSKLFFRIGEVAGLVGVEPHVLRYWEREFRSIRPTKSAKGQRVYSRKDVENLLRVRDLLYRDGFTIAGAKKRLQRGPADEPAPSASAMAHEEPPHDRETVRELECAGAEDGDSDRQNEQNEQKEVLSLDPESGPRSLAARAAEPPPNRVDPVVHEKLTALRAEVEAFLDELETGA